MRRIAETGSGLACLHCILDSVQKDAIFCTVCEVFSSSHLQSLFFFFWGVIVSREKNFLSISLELPRALGPTSSGCLRGHHGVSWPTWGVPIELGRLEGFQGFPTVSTFEALGDHVGHQGGHGSEEPGASLPKSSSAVGSFGCGDFRDSCFQELKACVN